MNARDGLRAAMAEVDAYYKQRGIFQDRFGFGQRPALVVIDMAYGWTDPAYAGGSARLDAAVAAIARLLPAARSAAVPVVYTTSPYSDTPPLKSAADFSPNYRRWDPRACEIDERLRPLQRKLTDLLEESPAEFLLGTNLVNRFLKRLQDQTKVD